MKGGEWVQGCPCYVAASYTSRRAWHRFLCLLVLLLWRACRSIRHPRVVLCSSDEEKPWPDSQVMRTPKDTTNSTTKIMNSAVCAICLRPSPPAHRVVGEIPLAFWRATGNTPTSSALASMHRSEQAATYFGSFPWPVEMVAAKRPEPLLGPRPGG